MGVQPVGWLLWPAVQMRHAMLSLDFIESEYNHVFSTAEGAGRWMPHVSFVAVPVRLWPHMACFPMPGRQGSLWLQCGNASFNQVLLLQVRSLSSWLSSRTTA